MEMKLVRDRLTDKSTTGVLTINGRHECYILEDVDRKLETYPERKIPHETAIPRGRYKIVVTLSPRFNRRLPLLLNVPGFEGIRIHTGNSAADTDGCLLPGQSRVTDWVSSSAIAYNSLYAKITAAIQAGNEVWLTIE